MNKFIVVRHGESEQHIKNLTGGWTDVPLTEKGINQAKRTGEKLKSIINGETIFLSSDLQRAKQTAKEIEKSINISPAYFKDLRELNNGDAAGLTTEEAKKIHCKPTKPILDWIPYPNAESWNMMRNRIHQFLNRKIEANKYYLILSHGNAIIEIVNWYLNIPQSTPPISYDIDKCSITILRINEWEERTINKLNDTSHLL